VCEKNKNSNEIKPGWLEDIAIVVFSEKKSKKKEANNEVGFYLD